MKPSTKSSELYIIIYVLLLLGAKYLGLDLHSIQAQVQQVAGAYHGTGGADSAQLVALALVWLGARSGLKALDIKKKNNDSPPDSDSTLKK